LWEAEHAIAHLRYQTMTLACLRLDLPASYARGFDRLPAEARVALQEVFVRSLESNELTRALSLGLEALMKECEVAKDDERILERLREMAR
jgi:hypothetical protein